MSKAVKIGIVFAATFVSACAGEDAVLFASGAQVGIDADGAKQSINIGIDRYEGVTAPTYQNAVAPPVYARLESNGGYFNPVVTSLHATGHAALVASKRVKPVKRELASKEFDLVDYTAIDKTREKRRVFFGTNTNGGLKIGFAQARPPSFNFGVKRQELSVLPLTPKIGSDMQSIDGKKLVYGSVIGRMDFGGRTNSMRALGIELQQYVATGQAAIATANCIAIDAAGKIQESSTCDPGTVTAATKDEAAVLADETLTDSLPPVASNPAMGVEQAPVEDVPAVDQEPRT